MGTWGLGAPGSTPAGSGFQGQRRHQPADPAPRRHQTDEGRGHKLELARGLSCKALELADEVGLVVKGVAHQVLPVDTLTGKAGRDYERAVLAYEQLKRRIIDAVGDRKST